MNSRGQSLVETAVALPLVVGVFVFFFGACYAVFARAWINYQTDQALFCSAEVRHGDCQSLGLEAMKRFLPWGRLHFTLNQETSDAEAEWTWKDGRFQREKILKMDSRLWR